MGRHVTRELLLRGHAPYVVSRTPESADFGVQVRQTNDIFSADQRELRELLDGIEGIVHLAWHVNPLDYLDSDENWRCLIGSVNLARVSREMGIKHFLGIGTCLEYDRRDSVLTSMTPLGPDSVYASAKTSLFFALSGIFNRSTTDFAWARLFFMFGDGENPKRLVPYIRSQISQGLFPSLRNPSAIRDYLDVAEVGKRIAKIADSRLTGAHNICSGKPISLFELAKGIAIEMGREDLVEEEPHEREPDHSENDQIVGLPSPDLDRNLDV